MKNQGVITKNGRMPTKFPSKAAFGAWLTHEMRERKLSPLDVGEAVGSSARAVELWAEGHHMPSSVYARDMAVLLKVDATEMDESIAHMRQRNYKSKQGPKANSRRQHVAGGAARTRAAQADRMRRSGLLVADAIKALDGVELKLAGEVRAALEMARDAIYGALLSGDL